MSLVTMTKDDLKDILSAIKSVGLQQPSPPPPQPTEKKGSFLQCTERFRGECNNKDVESFFAKTSAYKRLDNIDDKDALEGLSFLLKD